MDPRAVGYRITEQDARDLANRSRNWDGQPRDRDYHFDYPDQFYQRNNSVDRPRGRESERASCAKIPVDYRNEEKACVRFRKLRDLDEREKRERRQEEDEEEGEYLELEDYTEEEELDDGGSKLVDRPWLPKERSPKTPAVVSKSKGKTLKPTGVVAVASSSKEANDSIAISKKFELEFEDPAFSIELPRLDGFVLRHAKDKDRVKAVNASEEALIQTQLKIMDVAPSLFDSYTKKCFLGEGETVMQAKNTVQAVLQQ
ncbi:hypothetical protein OUZ56_017313 [Daphnia magna]|uniref:Uncharacterized protein n=1 Tax=Daphnia magna TaxID=35525 RepID=A0ABR0ASV5_9CRUS|nr:hypothetical protein OUZ56_017313 [Daphnia magna]